MSAALWVLDELKKQGVSPTGLSADSRQLAPGDVFLAMPGARSDGRACLQEAVARGAVAVLWEREGIAAVEGAKMLTVPNVGVTHLREHSGEIAHLVYGRPSEKLRMVGVTGTNGKTSVSQWIAQALTLLGKPCAVIGTLGNGFPGELQDSPNTTPDAVTLQRVLAGFVAADAAACAMEVSSIGLDQGRVAAVAFDIAVFTNLTRDHLEYHGSMEAYGAAKKQLFVMPGIKAAVINLDDPFGVTLCAGLAGGVRRIGYTLEDASTMAGQADEIVAAENLVVTGNGLAFNIRTRQGEVRIEAPLLGRFNAANLLAVLGTLLASGIALEQAAKVLPVLTPPPGRMQAAACGQDEPLVVIDYAHSPDALEQALATLAEIAAARGGKIICLFGCGGERDPGKRPLMGKVAEFLADRVLLTNDNPRGEDPQAIIDDILRGTSGGVSVEPDRAAAIQSAVMDAAANDVVLVAGKGHEHYQEIAGRRLPFSDLEQARAALFAWRAAA